MVQLNVTDYVAITNKITPDIGYEIEDEKYHTWQITN